MQRTAKTAASRRFWIGTTKARLGQAPHLRATAKGSPHLEIPFRQFHGGQYNKGLDKTQAVCHSPQMNPHIPSPPYIYLRLARLERDRAVLRAALKRIVEGDEVDGDPYGNLPVLQCVIIAVAALEATKDQP